MVTSLTSGWKQARSIGERTDLSEIVILLSSGREGGYNSFVGRAEVFGGVTSHMGREDRRYLRPAFDV